MTPGPWRAVAAVAAIAVFVAGAALAAAAVWEGVTAPRPPGTSSVPADPAPTSVPAPLSEPSDPAPTSTRPPLSDPPDPGPAPEHHGLARAELEAAVESSVRVTGPACRGILTEGSGFAVRDGDLIVTNAHLMVGMHEPTVELADGRVLEAVPVVVDVVNDLAVLRAEGAGLEPLPLSEAVPDGTVGAVLAWEAEGEPDPTPFRIDRPVTVRTDAVASDDRIDRWSWLLAAEVELGDSGAALVAPVNGRTVALGVVWSASSRGDVDVAYATRSGVLEQLLASSDLDQRVEVPECP